MSLYLDASALVPLFIQEATTERLWSRLAGEAVLVSGFAAAEFSAAVARWQRIGELSAEGQAAAYAEFDRWVAQEAIPAIETSADMQAANLLVRASFGLRTPDAFHVAVAQRMGAKLFTLDHKMAAAAVALGLPVET